METNIHIKDEIHKNISEGLYEYKLSSIVTFRSTSNVLYIAYGIIKGSDEKEVLIDLYSLEQLISSKNIIPLEVISRVSIEELLMAWAITSGRLIVMSNISLSDDILEDIAEQQGIDYIIRNKFKSDSIKTRVFSHINLDMIKEWCKCH